MHIFFKESFHLAHSPKCITVVLCVTVVEDFNVKDLFFLSNFEETGEMWLFFRNGVNKG